jgi:high-affinity Fe2+/Pb2+ permease
MIRVPLWVWFQVAVAAVSAAAGFYCAAKYYGAKLDAIAQQNLVEQAALKAKIQLISSDLANREKEREALQAKLKDRVKAVVAKPRYRQQCLDADGVRIVNDALAGRDSP